jgi:hypothetical protein
VLRLVDSIVILLFVLSVIVVLQIVLLLINVL